MARFMLKNKNHDVLEFEYDLDVHQATRIVRIVDAAYAPIGLTGRQGEITKHELNYW